jgi:putative membrane protein insertion efficiency factor
MPDSELDWFASKFEQQGRRDYQQPDWQRRRAEPGAPSPSRSVSSESNLSDSAGRCCPGGAAVHRRQAIRRGDEGLSRRPSKGWLAPGSFGSNDGTITVNPAQHALLFLLRIYRGFISPVLTALFTPLGFGCRFTPTCSRYAIEAVRVHGALHGGWLSVRRVCRCHPWGSFGEDPVPSAKHSLPESTLNSCRNGS